MSAREAEFSKPGTINGCGNISKIHYIIYGILAISILPLAAWTCYKHIKLYYSPKSISKVLYRLSITIYLCTIFGSLLTVITSFGACIFIFRIWGSLWLFQSFLWILQWQFFIILLFCRYLFMHLYII